MGKLRLRQLPPLAAPAPSGKRSAHFQPRALFRVLSLVGATSRAFKARLLNMRALGPGWNLKFLLRTNHKTWPLSLSLSLCSFFPIAAFSLPLADFCLSSARWGPSPGLGMDLCPAPPKVSAAAPSDPPPSLRIPPRSPSHTVFGVGTGLPLRPQLRHFTLETLAKTLKREGSVSPRVKRGNKYSFADLTGLL